MADRIGLRVSLISIFRWPDYSAGFICRDSESAWIVSVGRVTCVHPDDTCECNRGEFESSSMEAFRRQRKPTGPPLPGRH